MRRRIASMLVLSLMACGSPAGESAGESTSESEGTAEGTSEGEGTSASEGTGGSAPERQAEHEPATPSCDRVRPCIEAFIEVAPADLAGPARVALAQLDTTLAETSAREPACRAALVSYRHDLESREVDVPDACR